MATDRTDLMKAVEKICDEYCKFKDVTLTEDELMEKYCNDCPFNDIVPALLSMKGE